MMTSTARRDEGGEEREGGVMAEDCLRGDEPRACKQCGHRAVSLIQTFKQGLFERLKHRKLWFCQGCAAEYLRLDTKAEKVGSV